MDFKFKDKSLIEDILKRNKDVIIRDAYNMALIVIKAAPDFEILNKITCLNLKKYLSKKDTFSIKLGRPEIRLVFKKNSPDSVSIITIITS